jgi:peptide/nickel transport system substrate-binding protein
MKSIIIYISTLCIVLTFVSCGKDSTENKDHLVFVIMKALISSLDPAFSKYNLIYGLAITFSMVYSIRRKLNINPILPNLGLFLLMQNLYLRCERTSIFKSTFYLVTIVRTVNASDFEYSLNRLLDEKSLLPAVGFYKT